MSDNQIVEFKPFIADSNRIATSLLSSVEYIITNYPTAQNVQQVVNGLGSLIGQLQLQINDLRREIAELRMNQQPPQINITNNVPPTQQTFDLPDVNTTINLPKKGDKLVYEYDRNGNIISARPVEE